MQRFLLCMSVCVALCATNAMAAAVSFTGAYSENFDSMGTAGTTMPAGYQALGMSGDKNTYTAANPITAAAIGAAYVGNQTINPQASTSNWRVQDDLQNQGSPGNENDRTLATGPTGTAATGIELALTNNTGGPLSSVTFAYDMKCIINGNVGDESGELPGYAFGYQDGAGTWALSAPLSLSGYTAGTTYNGSTTLNFATPVANGGTMLFRWADDNNIPNSPDQNFGIDNVSVTATVAPEPGTISLCLAGLAGLFLVRRFRGK